jgi:hypothetical protein
MKSFMKSVVVVCGSLFAGFSSSTVKARRQKSTSLSVEALENRALLSATVADPTPHEVRVEQHQEKHEQSANVATSSNNATDAVFASMQNDSHVVARDAKSAVARKKTPTINPDKSGLVVNVTSTTDGHITASGSEEVEAVDFINGKKPSTIMSLGGDLTGAGADDVSAINVKFNGTTVAMVSPQGAGHINLGTFNVGILKNGTAHFEIWVTMKSTAHGEPVGFAASAASVRHLKNSLPLILQTNNVVKATWTGGDTQPVITPTLIVTGNPVINQGQSGTVYVGLSSAPAAAIDVTIMSSNPSVVTVSPTVLHFTPTNWGQQPVTVTALATGSTSDVNVTITATSTLGNASTTVTVKGNSVAVESARPVLSGNPTIESGATGTLQLTLDKAPLATMVVNVTSNSGNATIQGASQFTFTTSNWNVPQTVTVRNTSPLVVDSVATITATDSVGSSSANVNLKGVTGGTGAHSVTWNVVSFIDLNNEDVTIQGITFQHTYANHAFYATFDTTGSGDSVTQIGDTHTTDANGAGITTFTPTTLVAGRHGEIRVVGTSDETFDAADNPVILVIKNGQVLRLQQGNGLTYSQGIWYMNLSEGIPN